MLCKDGNSNVNYCDFFFFWLKGTMSLSNQNNKSIGKAP